MFSLIQAAGWPIWFLVAASIIAVALIVERFISLRRGQIIPAGLLDEVLLLIKNRQVSAEMVTKLERSSPLGRILAAGLTHGSAPRSTIKEAMEEAGRSVSHDLSRYLSALGTVATTAPLLGLFGTVVGMIEIFGSQAPTGIDPERLSYGISVALYNTAFGILIAIPSLIFYRHFRARVEHYMTDMEQEAVRLTDALTRLQSDRR